MIIVRNKQFIILRPKKGNSNEQQMAYRGIDTTETYYKYAYLE